MKLNDDFKKEVKEYFNLTDIELGFYIMKFNNWLIISREKHDDENSYIRHFCHWLKQIIESQNGNNNPFKTH